MQLSMCRRGPPTHRRDPTRPQTHQRLPVQQRALPPLIRLPRQRPRRDRCVHFECSAEGDAPRGQVGRYGRQEPGGHEVECAEEAVVSDGW